MTQEECNSLREGSILYDSRRKRKYIVIKTNIHSTITIFYFSTLHYNRTHNITFQEILTEEAFTLDRL